MTILIRFFQGTKALEQFLEFVKLDSGSNLVGMSSNTLSANVPKDATVHELTSNTIWYIEHLYEHYDVIGDILQQDQLYSSQMDNVVTHKSQSLEDRNKTFLGLYISE